MFAARWLANDLNRREIDEVWRAGIAQHELFLAHRNDFDAELLTQFPPSCIG